MNIAFFCQFKKAAQILKPGIHASSHRKSVNFLLERPPAACQIHARTGFEENTVSGTQIGC
jgi:hypothetical protein